MSPVLVPSNYFISIHFKTGDPWTFYRCMMRGYLISTYIAAHEATDDADDTDKAVPKSQIRRAMYNSAETVMHADNVFHFDDVIISEYDAIIGMLTRMSRWFKFKLDQSVPRKAFSSVEDGSALMSTADYFVHQLDAAFKVVDTDDNTTTTMMSINEFMDDLTADIDNANSSKVLAAWDATRRAAAATRRAPGAAWTATKSAARSVAGAVSGMASRANATRKNVSARIDESITDRAETFAARRRAAAAAAAAADTNAGGGRQVALQQMKQTGGAYKNAEAFAGMMTKLKRYVGDDGAPANKPAMLADEYFERLSKVVAGVSRPSIFGHPLLLYLPFARAFNCVIYVYKPSQSDTDNYILKYIFRGAEESEEEVHEIHILDKNPDGDGSAFLDESYSSRFALLVLSGNSGTVGSDSTAIGATFTGAASSTAATAPLIKRKVDASGTPDEVEISPPADAPIIVSSNISTDVPTPILMVNPTVPKNIQLFGVIFKYPDITNEKILEEMLAKGYKHNQMLFLYNENAEQFKNKTDIATGSGNGKYRAFRIDTPTENYVMRNTGNINTFGIPTMTRDANNTVAEGIEHAFTELNMIIAKNPNLRFIFFNTMTKDDYEKNVNQLYAKNPALKTSLEKEFDGFTFDHKKDPQIGLGIAITDNLARRENLDLLLTKFRELQTKYGYKVIETTADITAIPNAASAVVAPTPLAKPAITPPNPVPKVDPKSIRLMTFNTCWEALDAKAPGTLDMTHCGTTPNKCRSNINTVIKRSIDDKYDFILLQEMTTDFDAELVGSATTTRNITSSDFTNVVEYEFDNEFYKGYGYKFLSGKSNMGILSLKKADTVVVGNLSAIPYDRKSAVIYGGNRPFIILVFTADKRIVMNVHAPQPRKFKDKSKSMDYTKPEILQKIDDAAKFTPSKISKSDIDNKQVISQYRDMQEYAFRYVIPNAIQTKLGLSIEELKTYQFIIAGDFNSKDPQIGLNGLSQIVDGKLVSGLPFLNYVPAPDGNALTGNKYITCAFPTSTKLTNYKTGALSDHILSNMKMKTDSYKIFDGKIDGVDIPGILEVPPKFSDHLPVYATITSEKED